MKNKPETPSPDDLAALRELVREAALDACEEAIAQLRRSIAVDAEAIAVAIHEKLDALSTGVAMLLDEDMPEALSHVDLAGKPIE